MTRKPARRFVVGYLERGRTTVYGLRRFLDIDDPGRWCLDYCERMTLPEARRALKDTDLGQDGAVVFELVPVEPKA
ncbi:MAG: hypothetical protein ACYTAO_19200 [Planctomycetota bacterium]|jgi:hypothetical protein